MKTVTAFVVPLPGTIIPDILSNEQQNVHYSFTYAEGHICSKTRFSQRSYLLSECCIAKHKENARAKKRPGNKAEFCK